MTFYKIRLFHLIGVFVSSAFSIVFLLWFGRAEDRPAVIQKIQSPLATTHDAAPQVSHASPSPVPRLHILLPANHADVNLCKLLAGVTALGYPTPTLLGWNQDTANENLLGGGSHMTKISGFSDYVNSLDANQEDDLIIMIDAYDVWLQVRPATLIARYHRVVAESNERMQKAMGDAANAHKLSNRVLFGTGKRCAPNMHHTVACYPILESPAWDDMYGANTDTVIGRNAWYSYRQAYLNSGFIMGTPRALRPLLDEAFKRSRKVPDLDPEGRGDGFSDRGYHGSDQSIFAKILGEQEYQRETMRLASLPWHARLFRTPTSQPRKSRIEGAVIDNVLDPSFTHEPFRLAPGEGPTAREYGITLDYYSDISHQTINSETDAQWLIYHDHKLHPAAPTLEFQIPRIPRNRFDCKPRFPPDGVPLDMTRDSRPFPLALLDTPLANRLQEKTWSDIPLYTHLCMGTIPALIHFNGIKEERNRLWYHLWYQPYLRILMADRRRQPVDQSVRPQTLSEHRSGKTAGALSLGGAWTDGGEYLEWDEVCPVEFDEIIFGQGNEVQSMAQPMDFLSVGGY